MTSAANAPTAPSERAVWAGRRRAFELRFLATILMTPGQGRHALRWWRSRTQGYLLDTPSPWLTFDAIDLLRAHMRDGLNVFEYGSGGSTLFWLRWNVDLVSVEHDPEWYEVVRGRLPSERAVDYRLVEPEPAADANRLLDPADPLTYATADDTLRARTFRRYATQIDGFPDGHFDLVLIDGRARSSCIHHAAPKVRRGGLLVLDNADRPYYLASQRHVLDGFEYHPLPGVGPQTPALTRTDVYVRT
jgi:hypothetical protein